LRQTQGVDVPAGGSHVKKSESPTHSIIFFFREIGGAPLLFPTNPIRFTIPGHTLGDAQVFVQDMCCTVLWNLKKATHENLPKLKSQTSPPGSGHLSRKVSSRKKHVSRKCGCSAKFTITHHIQSDSLRVVWLWDHNQQFNSLEDMQSSRLPPCVAKLLDDRVLSGDKWKNIHKDIRCPKVLVLEGPSNLSKGC
ncbi:hypothetical protein VP01_5594g1, partial [Puccinia sorghi]